MSSQAGQTAETSESPPPAVESAGVERAKPERPATDSMADGVGSRSSYAVALDVFEGPLDLLLHLVRRHELDILDIPIAFITEKYIEYISLARSLDIEVAGEYLLMAATLAFLKSRELLPVIPGEDEDEQDEEDGVDPREELIRRLIEYERFRDAGLELSARPIAGRDVFPRGGDLSIEPPEPGLAPVTLFRLAEAYNRVLDRAVLREDHEVVLEPITVRQRVQQLSLLLSGGERVDFEKLFLQQTWPNERALRQMLVVTLMSVLEMVKLGVLGVHQAHGSDAIELELTVDVTQLQQVVADFRGDDEEIAAAAAAAAAGGPVASEAVAAAPAGSGDAPSIAPERVDPSAELGAELGAESDASVIVEADVTTEVGDAVPDADLDSARLAEELAADEPVVEESVVEEPADEFEAEEPAAEVPAVEESAVEELEAKEREAEEPAAEDSADEPEAEEPEAEEPAAEEREAEEPEADEPTAPSESESD
ncbi:segregation and condensation protein A [Enhygromyxa salina]|uniref:Segregation and condensation protein A n=1 Tax=Enhygromyxa salina TaxID=215803 RepID=A0A2S9Y385_9BACT|nr:segregation/condensation protein A [Enhygromyxa salina]PRP99567.1 Segregation and condensation protein A [Enhygromyxa salina]